MNKISDDQKNLMQILSDGENHSGEDIAQTLGKSRTMVWKNVKALKELGVPIEAVKGEGYLLRTPIDFIDNDALNENLSHLDKFLDEKYILNGTTSTNQFLFDQGIPKHNKFRLATCEIQTAGRGRRGNSWHSPYAQNLYFSLDCRFDSNISKLSGLSILMGIACADFLSSFFGNKIKIKWPNDLIVSDAKIGGILVEIKGDTEGPIHMVVGAGINIYMQNSNDIDQPWTSISQELPSMVNLNRTSLLSNLVESFITHFNCFRESGLKDLMKKWSHFDYLHNKEITWHRGFMGEEKSRRGIAKGIDENGCLKIEIDGNTYTVHSGEIGLIR